MLLKPTGFANERKQSQRDRNEAPEKKGMVHTYGPQKKQRYNEETEH
jgi:hypothetical protein